MRTKALKELLILALPIIFGQIGLMLIGTGDMIIAGQYSRECLAAIGLAISVVNPIQISILGLQFAISPLLAQKRGAGEDVRGYFWTVMVYSLGVGLLSFCLTLASLKFLPYFGYEENITRLMYEYILITSPSVFDSTGYVILSMGMIVMAFMYMHQVLTHVTEEPLSLNFDF